MKSYKWFGKILVKLITVYKKSYCFICFLKHSIQMIKKTLLVSRNIPRYFWVSVLAKGFSLKDIKWMICFYWLKGKYYLFILFRGIRIETHFHWNAYLLIILKSLFKSILELSMFLSIEKSEVLSANNLGFDAKSSDKLLIYIRINNALRTEPWRTPPSTSAHEECRLFNMIPCFLSFKNPLR